MQFTVVVALCFISLAWASTPSIEKEQCLLQKSALKLSKTPIGAGDGGNLVSERGIHEVAVFQQDSAFASPISVHLETSSLSETQTEGLVSSSRRRRRRRRRSSSKSKGSSSRRRRRSKKGPSPSPTPSSGGGASSVGLPSNKGTPEQPLPATEQRSAPSGNSCNKDMMPQYVDCWKHKGTGWHKPCEELWKGDGLVGDFWAELDLSFDFGMKRAKITKVKVDGGNNNLKIEYSEDGETWKKESDNVYKSGQSSIKSGSIIARRIRMRWEGGKATTKAWLYGCEPQCSDSDGCNGNGRAKWVGDRCDCQCKNGFTGPTCSLAACGTFSSIDTCAASYCSWISGKCVAACVAGNVLVEKKLVPLEFFGHGESQVLACPTGFAGDVIVACSEGIVMRQKTNCKPGKPKGPVIQAVTVGNTGLSKLSRGCKSEGSRSKCLGGYDGTDEWAAPCCWKDSGFSKPKLPGSTTVDPRAKCRSQAWVEPKETARDYGGELELNVQVGYTCGELQKCSKSDGSGKSRDYPCKCGPTTCKEGDVCQDGVCLKLCKGIPFSAQFDKSAKCEVYGKSLKSKCGVHVQTNMRTGYTAADVCPQCGQCFVDTAGNVNLGKWTVTVAPSSRDGPSWPHWRTSEICGLPSDRFQVRPVATHSVLDPTILCGNVPEDHSRKGTVILESERGALVNSVACLEGDFKMFVASSVFAPQHMDCACPLWGCDGCFDGKTCKDKKKGATPGSCDASKGVWCSGDAACFKKPLPSTCKAMAGTGYNKPCTLLATEGLVGSWWKKLDIAFDFGKSRRITGVESNKGGYEFQYSNDGKTWEKGPTGAQFEKPVVAKHARVIWGNTGKANAIAQIIGCGDVEPKPTQVCTSSPLGYTCSACRGQDDSPCESMSGMGTCDAGKCGSCSGSGVSSSCPSGKKYCVEGVCAPFDPNSFLFGYESKRCGPRGEKSQVCTTPQCTIEVPKDICSSMRAQSKGSPQTQEITLGECVYSKYFEYECTSSVGLKNIKRIDNLECGDDYLRKACKCKSGKTASYGKLTVSSVCLPGLIAGAVNNVFQGPQAMHQVADKRRGGTVYFSWTEDLSYGADEAGGEGKIYVSKVDVRRGGAASLKQSAEFPHFVQNGGIDMKPDGTIGTLCAKYVPGWVRLFRSGGDVGGGGEPLPLAVCEVDSGSMRPKGTPWLIGKHYTGTSGPKNTHGYWGTYSHSYGGAKRVTGSGYLIYSPKQDAWSTWFGANVGSHLGYAMHSYKANAKKIGGIVPDVGIDMREKFGGPWADQSRQGTGDHSTGGTWRYHPKIEDIGLMKHTTHGNSYMQQYGLGKLNAPFQGGHGGFRLDMKQGDDKAQDEGSMRPCGNDWIMAFASKKSGGSAVCAKVTKNAKIIKWSPIRTNIGTGFRETHSVRLATLGSNEKDARCDRFLMGYMTKDKRYLQEVDGNCNKRGGPIDVSAKTTWSMYQDWDTTTDGAVVWVTAWKRDASGKALLNEYGSKPSTGDKILPANPKNSFTYGFTDGATNEAQISSYWP